MNKRDMEGNQFFGAANPPAPPFIAVLQIMFQMGCLAGIFLTLNYIIEGYSADGISFFLPWVEKAEEEVDQNPTELELLTQNLLHANKLTQNIVIVAMNERAISKCLGLCLQYKGDRLVFCRLDKSVSDTSDQSNKAAELLVDKFDLVAISDGGEQWTGLNMSEAEKMNEVSKIKQLRDCVVDCWLMRLVVGNGAWTSAKEVEIPTRYPDVSKL